LLERLHATGDENLAQQLQPQAALRLAGLQADLLRENPREERQEEVRTRESADQRARQEELARAERGQLETKEQVEAERVQARADTEQRREHQSAEEERREVEVAAREESERPDPDNEDALLRVRRFKPQFSVLNKWS
jgi:hypothetical protein